MKLTDINNLMLNPALSLLPDKMDSREARIALLSIGQIESGFRHRKQIGGPAHGYYQFEEIGVRGVLEHRTAGSHASQVLDRLDLDDGADEVYKCIQYNDVVATVIARLYLYTDPQALPDADDEGGMWDLYKRVWRPGKPRPDDWPDAFAWAHEAINED